jgi:DNA-binding SARP family transcriptional activator
MTDETRRRAQPLELHRRLLPRLTLIAAMAGSGKTMLAERIAERYPSSMRLNCGDASDAADLAARLRVAGERAPIVLVEKAEHAAADAERLQALESALAEAPAATDFVICSRSAIDLRTSRIAPPHRVLALDACDLFLTADEAAAMLEHLSPQMHAAVFALTKGWPVGVLYFQRFGEEGYAHDVLADCGSHLFEPIRHYLADEVIGSLGAARGAAFLAATALDGASAVDIAQLAPGFTLADARALARVCPLFHERDERFYAEGILDATIRAEYREEADRASATIGQRYHDDGAFLRAAEIYRAAGMNDEMIQALVDDVNSAHRTTGARFLAFLTTLPHELALAHPFLRVMTTYVRRYRTDPALLRQEVLAAWSSFSGQHPLEVRATAGCWVAQVLFEGGDLDQAESLLRTLEAEYGALFADQPTTGQSFVAATLGRALVRRGMLADAEPYLDAGYLRQAAARFNLSTYFLERAAIALMRGEDAEERKNIEAAIEDASAAESGLNVAVGHGQGAFSAWLRGDHAAATRHLGELQRLIERHDFRALQHFCSVAKGNVDAERLGIEQPQWLARAYLIAASRAAENRRADFALRARSAAATSNEPFLRVLAEIAVAMTIPAQRDEALAAALRISGSIQTSSAQAGVIAIVSDTLAGSFASFAQHFRARERSDGREIRVDVLLQKLFVRGNEVALGDKETALAVALARELRAYSASELCDELWPALDEKAARDALNSCLYRIRRRLGKHAIVFGKEGYALAPQVRVDLREIERWHLAMQRLESLDNVDRSMFSTLAARLRLVKTPQGATWEFLDPVLTRAREIHLDITRRLAEDALEQRRYDVALAMTREMLATDRCDEKAREIAIRAHIAAGDRAAALTEYRVHERALWDDLQIKPSPSLLALIRAD